MADMFGAPLGVIASDVQFNKNRQADLDAAVTLGQLAAQPAEREMKQLQVQSLRSKLEQEAKLRKLAETLPQTNPDTGKPYQVAETLDRLGTLAINAGAVDRGTELVKNAALIKSTAAQEAERVAQAQARAQKVKMERLQLIGQLFGAANSQASWDQAGLTYTTITGQQNPFIGTTFTPDLAKRISEQSMTAKERLAAEQTRTDREATRAYREATLALRRRQLDQGDVREEGRNARANARGKTVGNAPPVPNKLEREDVRALLGDVLPEGTLDDKSLSAAAVDQTVARIAGAAKQLRKANPALSFSEAAAQVIEESLKNGELDLEEQKTGPFPWSSKKRFKGPTKAIKAAPAPIPMSNGKPNAKALVVGKVYTNAAGVSAKWDGQNFVRVD